MSQLMKLVNIELTVKLLASALAIASIAVTGAYSIDTGIAAQDALSYEHKVYLDENADPASEDDMSLEEYEASQQAKTAKHANDVIAKAYGREL